jgi:hypothetical protein
MGLAEGALGMTAMESQELSEKLLALVHQMATAALAVPPEDLESWLKRNRQICFDEAVANKVNEALANEWADEMDSAVRSLIALIQNSGGAPGGTA